MTGEFLLSSGAFEPTFQYLAQNIETIVLTIDFDVVLRCEIASCKEIFTLRAQHEILRLLLPEADNQISRNPDAKRTAKTR